MTAWCIRFHGGLLNDPRVALPLHEKSMNRLGQRIMQFLRTEDGPTAVEYAVMAAAVIAVCVLAIAQFGQTTSSIYTNQADKISTAS